MDEKLYTFPEALYLSLIANGYKSGLAKARVGAVVKGGIKTWEDLFGITTYPETGLKIKGVGEKTLRILNGMRLVEEKNIRQEAYWELVDETCNSMGMTSVRTVNVLRRNGYDSFHKLKATPDEKLINIPGVGAKTMRAIFYIKKDEFTFVKLYHKILNERFIKEKSINTDNPET